MEVIAIDKKSFEELEAKVDLILKFIGTLETRNADLEEFLLDNNQVCNYLNISARTLQRLRSKQQINYTIVQGAARYSVVDLKNAIDSGYIRTKKEYFENLIESHKRYVEQRNNTDQDQ